MAAQCLAGRPTWTSGGDEQRFDRGSDEPQAGGTKCRRARARGKGVWRRRDPMWMDPAAAQQGPGEFAAPMPDADAPA